jgi:NAD(P)-dependent dehydrogenase (short-subunit alcohol dehydrogenase family)
MTANSDRFGDLSGKVAIVTGAGRYRGIGRASALALAARGADLVVTGTGRDPDSFPDDEKQMGWRDVESLAAEISETGRSALPLVLDVTDADAVRAMIETAVARLGRVDILVNNAAAPMGADRVPVVEVDDEVFRRVIEVKVMGSYYCAKAVAQALIDRGEGGSIVMISSIAGKRGSANTAAYNAANFAINGFTQALAKELGPAGINVNAVCPGIIPTARWDAAAPERNWQSHVGNVPSGRPGTFDEVGELVAYLCSPAAGYINGQAINIDGGLVTEH